MNDLINFVLLKSTGSSGYSFEISSLAFKSIDSATTCEVADSLNYPVYAPYLKSRSFSYENWIKLQLNLNKNIEYSLNSRGLTITDECSNYCYNRTYTVVKNIALWINSAIDDSSVIRIGLSQNYIKPVNTLSSIAIENLESYYVNDNKFNNLVKVPLTFNGGKSELLFTEVENAISDYYIVLQLEVLKGLTYQREGRVFSLNIHYDIE